MDYRYRLGEDEIVVQIEPDEGGYRVAVGERHYQIVVRRFAEGALAFEIDGHQHRASVASDGERISVALDGTTFVIERGTGQRRRTAPPPGLLTATMPGQVVAIYITAGDHVVPGQPLLLLTAMKMELTLSAPEAGVVRAINVAVGDTVARDQQLIELEPMGNLTD
jgi:acetyl/propionyl-CoA carboxylase alpha subunit